MPRFRDNDHVLARLDGFGPRSLEARSIREAVAVAGPIFDLVLTATNDDHVLETLIVSVADATGIDSLELVVEIAGNTRPLWRVQWPITGEVFKALESPMLLHDGRFDRLLLGGVASAGGGVIDVIFHTWVDTPDVSA